MMSTVIQIVTMYTNYGSVHSNTAILHHPDQILHYSSYAPQAFARLQGIKTIFLAVPRPLFHLTIKVYQLKIYKNNFMAKRIVGQLFDPVSNSHTNFLQAIKKRSWGKTANNYFRMREEYESSPNTNFQTVNRNQSSFIVGHSADIQLEFLEVHRYVE